MSVFVPSLRDCLHRLDRMRDTAQIVADIELLNAELWPDDGAAELNAAVARLTELHRLCLDMAANMSGGLGVPPTPPAAPVRKERQRPDPTSARPSIMLWTRTPDPSAAPPDTAAARAYSAVQAARALGVSRTYFYAMVRDGKVPRATADAGQRIKAAWPAGAIDEIARQRAAAPSKFSPRKDKAAERMT